MGLSHSVRAKPIGGELEAACREAGWNFGEIEKV